MKEIKWAAPEFEYVPKGVSWYWLTIIIAILLTALALWQRNFLFAVFVIIAEVLIVVWGGRYPRTVEFRLTERGLEIGKEKLYPYESLEGFSVRPRGAEDSGTTDEVALRKKSRLSPDLRIVVGKEKTLAIRSFLNRFLPELEHEESLVDHISRLLKF